MKNYNFEDDRIECLCGRLGASAYELTLRCRRRDICDRGEVVMWYLRSHDAWTLTRIAAVLGYSHATVIWAVSRVNELLEVRDKVMVELTNKVKRGDEMEANTVE